MSFCGLLNLHKPPGMTSRAAVDEVQKRVGGVKAGHAGTLDPLASGVLVVCLGPATRLVPYVQGLPKQYRATFLLGRHSPTEDLDGPVTELADPPIPTLQQLQAAARGLTGEILQRPPDFSALKVAGRRAYALARQGKPVPLPPRPVIVHRLEILAYEYPKLELEIDCGSGTYVRSLGRDLAASVGTSAVMATLVRTAIGHFTLEQAIPLHGLDAPDWTRLLLPPIQAVEHLQRVTLSAEEVNRVRNGQSIRRDLVSRPGEVAAVDTLGRLVAVLAPRGPGRWGPVCNLPPHE